MEKCLLKAGSSYQLYQCDFCKNFTTTNKHLFAAHRMVHSPIRENHSDGSTESSKMVCKVPQVEAVKLIKSDVEVTKKDQKVNSQVLKKARLSEPAGKCGKRMDETKTAWLKNQKYLRSLALELETYCVATFPKMPKSPKVEKNSPQETMVSPTQGKDLLETQKKVMKQYFSVVGQSDTGKSGRSANIGEVAKSEKLHSCKYCGFKCSSGTGLKGHIKSEHKCPFCGFLYSEPKLLVNHLKIHMVERRFRESSEEVDEPMKKSTVESNYTERWASRKLHSLTSSGPRSIDFVPGSKFGQP